MLAVIHGLNEIRFLPMMCLLPKIPNLFQIFAIGLCAFMATAQAAVLNSPSQAAVNAAINCNLISYQGIH